MTKYAVMTPEIEEIDREILRLKAKRARLVATEVKKKADALCAEIPKKKAA